MIISWLGQSCFKLQDKMNGRDITVVLDPFSPSHTGLKLPANLSADVVTISHQHKDHNFLSGVSGQPFVIDMAGEYEIGGLFIDGVDSDHDQQGGAKRGHNLIFRLGFSDLVVTHLGDLGSTLEAKQLERLAGTDILLVPVGGYYTLDAKQAIEVINQIEPKIVIPMHYKLPGLSFNLAAVDDFVKAIGLAPIYEDKLKVVRRDLDSENLQLIILSVTA
ncbi:MAG TPA: MBL fold metallo-hydrolase [bacterium]|nr:MBL fold metallo-hydrolase [bacterium]HNZ51333.1 MBL fold metallo-hydrolase [bacterium]HOF79678.1 MBL fold metallo-hydrolase [bacterium]HOH85200.1 MBL fold metallo-hydrolase [bacterium]HOQ91359.1 MBL fold metallo-hydrolase [bacterium]